MTDSYDFDPDDWRAILEALIDRTPDGKQFEVESVREFEAALDNPEFKRKGLQVQISLKSTKQQKKQQD